VTEDAPTRIDNRSGTSICIEDTGAQRFVPKWAAETLPFLVVCAAENDYRMLLSAVFCCSIGGTVSFDALTSFSRRRRPRLLYHRPWFYSCFIS
jgi:hypothetical protein